MSGTRICLSKIKILFAFIFLFANISRAETWISVGGGTDHFCHTCGYNNFNPGLGIQYSYTTDVKLIAGGYYNSFHKTTLYSGVVYQPVQYGIVKFGIAGAAVTNYSNLKVPLMALPIISVEGESVGLDILGGPSIGSYTGIVTANLKFKL